MGLATEGEVAGWGDAGEIREGEAGWEGEARRERRSRLLTSRRGGGGGSGGSKRRRGRRGWDEVEEEKEEGDEEVEEEVSHGGGGGGAVELSLEKNKRGNLGGGFRDGVFAELLKEEESRARYIGGSMTIGR